jgi:hypothetical protein
MGFSIDFLKEKSDIKKVIHVGADRGGELPQYAELGVEKVVWIEANPEVYGELLDNIKLMNIESIQNECFNQLISDKDDCITDFNLYYGPDAGYLVGNKGMSSILKASTNWWGSNCHRGTIQLNSLTLDTFLERHGFNFDFDMLNMDTQGAELMISKGATKVLDTVKYINCEITFFDPQYQNNPLYEELEEYFKQFNFKPIHIEMSAVNWGDVLFCKT